MEEASSIAYFSIYVLVFSTWQLLNGMTEICCRKVYNWTYGLSLLCLSGLNHYLQLFGNLLPNRNIFIQNSPLYNKPLRK
jgi:hypothetical protein